MVTHHALFSTMGELPPRSELELRGYVAQRTTRLRRRRRAVQWSVPAAVALVVAVLAAVAVPEWKAGVRTVGRESGPADEPALSAPPSEEIETKAGAAARVLPPKGSRPVPSENRPDGSTEGAPSPNGATTASSSFRFVFLRWGAFFEQRVDGSGLRRLPGGDGWAPSVSPDGTIIAYERGAAGHVGLRTIDVRTGADRRLVDYADADARGPAWSPDGSWVAFTRRQRVGVGRSEVWVVNPSRGESHRVGFGLNPSWTPDGRILHECDYRLCVTPRDGSASVVIPGTDFVYGARWSPDGAWIAGLKGGDLVVFRPDGSGRRTLTRDAWPEPAWFPDGSRIAVHLESQGSSGPRGIWSIRPDGGDPRPLTDDAYDRSPSFVATAG